MERKTTLIIIACVALLAIMLAGYWLFFSAGKQLGSKPVTVQNTEPNAALTPQTIKIEPPAQTFSADEKPAQIYQPNEKITVATPEKLPESTKFKSFAYDQKQGKIINVSGSCSDAYYAIVIFRAFDDYKKNPAAAVFNQAFDCPAGRTFSNAIELKNFNLPSGEYYFFVADQGKAGTWYNPR